MAPPLDPRTQAMLERLVKALNALAVTQTRQQRQAAEILALGGIIDPTLIEVPDTTVYDTEDAIQLVTEMGIKASRGFAGPLVPGRAVALSNQQWDELFFRILTTLPDQLTPGVARSVPPLPGPVPAHLRLADAAVTITSANIQRFPQHALVGMQEGAIALELFRNGRISERLFNDFVTNVETPGTAELQSTINANLPRILNAANAEAKGDDFQRAIGKVIADESKDGVVADPETSLFPVLPGFGAPVPRAFTEDEEDDLRLNPKKLVTAALPTGNQLAPDEFADEEQNFRRLFIDDVVDEINAAPTLAEKQAIIDGAAARFDTGIEGVVAEAESDEAQDEIDDEAEAFAKRFDSPTKIRAELANVLPTANQLETTEEKTALAKFLDDQVDRLQALDAQAARLGLDDATIAQTRQNFLQDAPALFEPRRAQAAAEPVETVTAKNAILSSAFQTTEFQAAVAGTTLAGREFESLPDETKVFARGLLAGLTTPDATEFARTFAPLIAQVAEQQEIQATEEEKIAELAKRREDFDPEAAQDFIDDALESQGFLTTDISPRARAGLVQELLSAEGQPSVLFPEMRERIKGLAEQEQITQATRDAFEEAGLPPGVFDQFFFGDSAGLGITPVGGIAPLAPGQASQTIDEIFESLRIQRDPSAVPTHPLLSTLPEPFDPAAINERTAARIAATQGATTREEGLQRQVDVQRVRNERARLLATPQLRGATPSMVPSFEEIEQRQQASDLAFRAATTLPAPIGADALGAQIRRVAGDDLGLEQFLFERADDVRATVSAEQKRRAGLAVPTGPSGLPEREKFDFSEFAFKEFSNIGAGFAQSDLALGQNLQRSRPETEAERRRKLRSRGRTVVRR